MEPYRATMKTTTQKIGYHYGIGVVELEVQDDHIHIVERSVPKQSPNNMM